MGATSNLKKLLDQVVPIWGADRVAEILEADHKSPNFSRSKTIDCLLGYTNSKKITYLKENHRNITKSLQRWVPSEPVQYDESFQGLLEKAVHIWKQPETAEHLKVTRKTVNQWLSNEAEASLVNKKYLSNLKLLLPDRPKGYGKRKFDFIDLFAGIGGLRTAFEEIDGKCVFTSEWDEFAQKTYMANYYDDHGINGNIKFFTEGALLAKDKGKTVSELTEKEIEIDLDKRIPSHDVLLAGFPCQPFSIAGVSKKNSLGRAHGFDCKLQGTLFFDICKILKVKKPACVLLENVKNLKSHNGGDTYTSIISALEDAGYDVPLPRVINAKDFLPQNRERIVIVAFRRDLKISEGFNLESIKPAEGSSIYKLGEILDGKVDEKYTLTPNLWEYLQAYKKRHRAGGNGFGYELMTPSSRYTRTLSARYHKDGSEILIAKNKSHAEKCINGDSIPRRLTPSECARLMGFDGPKENNFVIPVSDTQAYRQFGNSVAVPVFKAVALVMKERILVSKRKAG
ncbi:DNA (cytosine-5)-methyltransferase 1 [Alteromonadaceae bacterium Bs31]|nr:DNA (cytosine-5)-methyltransferase 1 [Alteromonadaceae bacterium Bs31]